MMKRKTKRALSMVLASSMMLSVSSYTAFAADYKDTVGHWSEKQVNLWSDYGVISGYDGLFRPDDSITRGEMAVIMDKVMKYQVKAENTFSDLDQNFYTDSVLKANQAGIMRGSDGAVRPKDNITREEASVLICQAFGIDPVETATSKFNDSDKVSTWAAGYVNALLQKGYISGKGDNNFDPQGNITRGEAVTMFNNIVKGFYHQAGTYTENITGNVVVNTPETVLKDMSVTGDIFVTQGVADGNLTLENVKAPTVIVRGGGVNSVKITGNSEIGTVKVEKQDGDVRVVTDGTAKVSNVYIKDGSKNSVLEGNMDKIQVDASNSTVRITNATVKELNVTKESAKVILDEKSIVDKLTIAETAANASVEINGTAKQVIVSAPNAILTTTKTAKVDTLTVTEKATNAKLELGGTITTVETSAQGTSINVAAGANITTIKALEKAADSKMTISGKVATILVDAPNVTIEVLKGGEVTTIESSATATGLIVKGEGKVSTIKVNGNNSKIDISGAKVIVGKDVTGTLVMGKEVKGGSTVTTGSDKTVTDGEIENPNGNQFVNPDNPNDEWNADDAMPQKAPEESWFTTESPTTPANDDGKITLASDDNDKYMAKLEYRLVEVAAGVKGEAWSDYRDWNSPTEEGLLAGTYNVRFKKGGSYLTGKDLEVTIAPCKLPNLSEIPDVTGIEVENGLGEDAIKQKVAELADPITIKVSILGEIKEVTIPGSSVEWSTVTGYDQENSEEQDIVVEGAVTLPEEVDIDGELVQLFDLDNVAEGGIKAQVHVKANEDAGTIQKAIDEIKNYIASTEKSAIVLPRWNNGSLTDDGSLESLIENYIKTQILTDSKYSDITIKLQINGNTTSGGQVSVTLELPNANNVDSPVELNFEVKGITYKLEAIFANGETKMQLKSDEISENIDYVSAPQAVIMEYSDADSAYLPFTFGGDGASVKPGTLNESSAYVVIGDPSVVENLIYDGETPDSLRGMGYTVLGVEEWK